MLYLPFYVLIGWTSVNKSNEEYVLVKSPYEDWEQY